MGRAVRAVADWLVLVPLLGLAMAVLVMIGFGVVVAPLAAADERRAHALDEDARWVTVDEAEVRVTEVWTGRGRVPEVTAARVRWPGQATWVDLQNVSISDSRLPDDVARGWQPPSPDTGYVPPFEVRVSTDPRKPAAMSRADYEYWTQDNTDVRTNLLVGLAGLVLAAAGVTAVMLPGVVRARRRPAPPRHLAPRPRRPRRFR